MKIIVLSGPGEVAKRAEAIKIRQQFSPDAVTVFDFKQNTLDQLISTISTVPLFISGSRLVVIENIPVGLDLEKISTKDENLTILLLVLILKAIDTLYLSAKKLGARFISFEGEKEISAFPFLDNLIEQKKQTFLELHKLLEEFGGVYILAMIYYLLRRNILPLPAGSFMQNKIKIQRQKYSMGDWSIIYRLVLETEFGIKSGRLEEKSALAHLTQLIIAGKYGE